MVKVEKATKRPLPLMAGESKNPISAWVPSVPTLANSVVPVTRSRT